MALTVLRGPRQARPSIGTSLITSHEEPGHSSWEEDHRGDMPLPPGQVKGSCCLHDLSRWPVTSACDVDLDPLAEVIVLATVQALSSSSTPPPRGGGHHGHA